MIARNPTNLIVSKRTQVGGTGLLLSVWCHKARVRQFLARRREEEDRPSWSPDFAGPTVNARFLV